MLRLERLGALAATVLLVAGCGGQLAGTGGGANAPIRVDLIGTFSGQNADLGNWAWNGVKLAVDQANARGGIDGRKIQLERLDDQGQPTVGTDLAKRAVSDHAVLVYGSDLSTVTLAMIPILTAARIPEITSGQAPAILQQGSSYIFLDSTTSAVFDQTLADYLVEKRHLTSIAMITNNDAYGKGEHDSFLAELTRLGVRPTIDKVVTPDQTDFTSVLTEIRATDPGVLFIGAEEVETGLIAKQARSLGITATFAGGAPMGTPTYIQTAGLAVAEGTIMTSPYLSNDANAKTRAFAAAYRKAYGQEPELHGAKAYDGMSVFIQAMRRTPTDLSGPRLIAAVRSIDYDGLLGHFKFDEQGLGLHATQVGVIKDGKVVPV
ncbi:MAG TPA: ABC transporter substrate-binding protein [Candidatus Dormibacteraeota bacterium]|jgi:branched-chain amino acid transport system substrate-binding protein|nr:ABC transporter substrate-binding protein [Candidatus Dormibacteraeota bacterium]